jgi:hypothetical protein
LIFSRGCRHFAATPPAGLPFHCFQAAAAETDAFTPQPRHAAEEEPHFTPLSPHFRHCIISPFRGLMKTFSADVSPPIIFAAAASTATFRFHEADFITGAFAKQFAMRFLAIFFAAASAMPFVYDACRRFSICCRFARRWFAMPPVSFDADSASRLFAVVSPAFAGGRRQRFALPPAAAAD